MTLGVVYCAVCKGYPGRCKIGKTFRNADQRIAELQRHYRSAHPFIKHDSLLVDNYSRVEWLAHQRLAHCREPATEMFRCTPQEAMAAIRWAVDEALRNPPRYQNRLQPRPKRAPQRTRRAGHELSAGLALVLIGSAGFYGLIEIKPDIPGWLPAPVQRAALWIENW